MSRSFPSLAALGLALATWPLGCSQSGDEGDGGPQAEASTALDGQTPLDAAESDGKPPGENTSPTDSGKPDASMARDSGAEAPQDGPLEAGADASGEAPLDGGDDAGTEDTGTEDAAAGDGSAGPVRCTAAPGEELCLLGASSCPEGQVREVIDQCWGDCVPIQACACDTPLDCPQPETFVCINSRKHCDYYL